MFGHVFFDLGALRAAGDQLEVSAKTDRRFLMLLPFTQQIPTSQVAGWMVGGHLDGTVEVLERLFQSFLAPVEMASIDVGRGKGGREFDRSIELGKGFGELSEVFVG